MKKGKRYQEAAKLVDAAKAYEAKEALKEQGIDQWQNGYPNADVIRNDILNNDSYVFIKNNEIVLISVGELNSNRIPIARN